MGHSCTTHTYSAVIWPHKLTVLKSQLPEAAAKLPVLQLPEVARSITFVLLSGQFWGHNAQKVHTIKGRALRPPPRNRFPHYICTTNRPALAARSSFPDYICATVLQALAVHCWGHSCKTLLLLSLVGHSCRTLLLDTLVEHSCGASFGTLAEHSCGTLLRDSVVGHSCRTLLWDSLARHSCMPLLWDTLVGHSCGTLLRGTLVGTLLSDILVEHSCGTLL